MITFIRTAFIVRPALLLCFCLPAILPAIGQQQAKILDLKHYSHVFGEERNFRIFLPPAYESSTAKRYPVIYFFHGWSERFNASKSGPGGYDTGYNGDNILNFVSAHDVIVVRWDGYNPRKPNEAYVRPYNVLPVETYRQFPLYFPELVAHIDANFRTLPDRAHRATAGLSMGGFMSFWVSGKYPHLIGSASNFMGSSEFIAGPNGFPSEYRHTEMYRNYEGVRTRIILGSRDFIRWYHRRMNAIWDFTRPHHEHEEFDWDHGTPGIAKTLSFHMAAFRDPLPKPDLWHHLDLYPTFDVWGYSVSSDRRRPGFTLLENVGVSGFRSSVREWLPEGGILPAVTLRVSTDPAYKPGAAYAVSEVNLSTGEVCQARRKADASGRLHFVLTGAPHEIGISAGGEPVLALAGISVAGQPWAVAGKPVRLKIAILNKGASAANAISASLSSPNKDVAITRGAVTLATLAAGGQVVPAGEFAFTVKDPDREIVQLSVNLEDQRGRAFRVPVEIPLFRDASPLPDFRVADGITLPVWDRAIRRVERVAGVGNGDGVVNPGETIAIAVRDGDAYRLAELFTNEPCIDMRLRVSDMWGAYDNVGASAKVSLPLISSKCHVGQELRFFARVQLPSKPEHGLREGVVALKVVGRDVTAPRVVWARMADWNRLEADVRDGGKVRSAAATLTYKNTTLKVPLNDEGLTGDTVAGDGVFTGLAPNPAPGPYKLSVSATDESGNSGESEIGGEFEVTLPRTTRIRE